MNLKEFSEKASRTCKALPLEKHNFHMLFGMVCETGELADIYKANLAYDRPIDMLHVKEELGDELWFIVNFCRVNNIDLEEVMDLCIAKLYSRYPEKFTEEKANNRDLVYERVTLEKAGKA